MAAPKIAPKVELPKKDLSSKLPVESREEFMARINGAAAANRIADAEKIRQWAQSMPAAIPTYKPPGAVAARRQVDTPKMGELRMKIAELENQIKDIQKPYNGVSPWPGPETYDRRGNLDLSYQRNVKRADTDKQKLGAVYRELRDKQTQLAHLTAARES